MAGGGAGDSGVFCVSWLAIAHVCMLHVGSRVAYFTSVLLKTLLGDTNCHPYSVANSVSFEACFAAFWLMSAARLPVALTAARADANLVAAYSPAALCLNLCRGRVSRATVVYAATFAVGAALLAGGNVAFYELASGTHSLRQVCYGGVVGAFFHVVVSVNVDILFHPSSVGENLPAAATRRRRIRTIVVAASNVVGMYFVSGALAYRVLRDGHRAMMWREVLAVRPAVLDGLVMLLFLFAIVRKGARRTGYMEYSAILPSEHPDHV